MTDVNGPQVVFTVALLTVAMACVYFVAVGLGPHLSDSWAEKFRGSIAVQQYSKEGHERERAGSS